MPLQLLSTKLSVPPLRSRLVRRTRLIQKLNQGHEYGLILVSAPAGYGKSTLLSAWLSQVDTPATWLTLDEGDNDPPRFIAYLAAALATIDPSLENIITSSQNFRVQPDIDQFLITPINHLSQLKRPFYLVLDDYHLIQDQTVHQVVNFLLDHCPNSMHLVIASRADPPLHLSKLRACSELLELRLTDLRFTNLEAADFLNHTMGVQISPEDVARITAHTEGWIAGLQIAALSMQKTEDISGFIASLAGSDYYIFDYLVEEILAQQSTEIRTFLLYTSILDQFTPSLCDALLAADVEPAPPRPSAYILKELTDKNLFIIPLDHERHWYRYHHLFSDLLKVILKQSNPDISFELHRRASAWYESQAMLSEALQHALDSGDMQLVAQIISTYVFALWDSDDIVPLLHKIDSMPLDQLVSVPWLGIARAWIVGIGDVQKTEQLLKDIELNLKNTPEAVDRQLMEGHIAAARANYFCVSGDFDQVIIQAKLALSILPETETILRARCLTLWGVALGNTQNSPAAIPIFEQALLLLRHANKPGATMFTTAKLAGACLFTGQMHYLRRICMEALEVAGTSQAHLHQQSSTTAEIYSMLSRVHAEWGENDQAIEFARKGLVLSEHWGHQAFICTCLFYLGRALVFSNDMEQARRIFQRTAELAGKVSPWLWQEIALLILDSLLDGDPTLSIEILSQVHLLEEHGVSLTPVLKARLLLRESKPDEAQIVLEEALAELNNQPAYNTIRYVALGALAHRAMGDENRALASLQQALEFGEAENRVASFVREGEAMEKLLRLAQPKTTTPHFVQRLLQAFEARHIIKPQPDIVSEALIEPLSEREMDILKLLAQGCSDRVIAKILVIAPDTVHKHLQKIYNKLDVHTRMEAILRARDLGLL